MNNDSPAPEPIAIPDPGSAELTASGHWAETQVIQSIKDANLRHRSPQSSFEGKNTVVLENSIIPSRPMAGKLILAKPRKRTRLRRFFSYFTS